MQLIFLFLSFFIGALFADFGVETQAEFHWKYQNLDFGLKDYLVYLRLEKAQLLPREWLLYLRLDVPYIWLWGKQTEIVSIDEDGLIGVSNRKFVKKKFKMEENGFSDLLTRFFFVTPPLEREQRLTLGFGSEFIFPSAQKEDLGTGKYSARPLVGVKYDFPKLGNGSWGALLVKYQFSFAGEKNRPCFRIFFIQPVFVYSFGKGWVFSTSPECQMDLKTQKWFVPIAANLGKVFNQHLSLSIQYQRGIVTSFSVFKDEIEATLRYQF